MLPKMMLAALLALSAAAALAADTSSDRQAAPAATSADGARAQAGNQVAGKGHAHACTCAGHGS